MKSNLCNKDQLTIPLYTRVKAGFLLQGTSLHRWCIESDISRQNAAQALKGIWNGPKAQALRAKIVKASGINKEDVDYD